jgi:iron complex transport system substrate-binding protein
MVCSNNLLWRNSFMYQSKTNLLLVLMLAVAISLSACTPNATAVPTATLVPTPEPLVFTDGLGRTVTLANPAQRIISLAPSNIEILYAIGAGTQVVGRDEFTNYPQEAANLPSIGGSFGGYNAEAIVNLKPDLVLAAEINTPEQVKTLEDLGLIVFYLSNPKDLLGMYENLLLVARMTGHLAETANLVETLKARVAAVEEKLAGVTEKPSVFYELDSTDANAPYTIGPGTFMDLLIGMAGGTNIGSMLEGPWAQISLEELLVQDPDLIILGDSNYGVTIESVAARAGWADLSAVKEGRVYPFNDDLVSRPGPRLVDGLEELAKLLHPELFK